MERPEKMVLVCSQAMVTRGQALARLLEAKGIATIIKEGTPDAGLANIIDYALVLAGELEAHYPGARITLNATGGTKLMAMGFIEAFRAARNIRILYTDTAHRRLETLPVSREAPAPPQPMHDVLDVPLYLQAQGFHFTGAVSDDPAWRERAQRRKPACKYLGQHTAELENFIGAINYLANEALERVPGQEQERLVRPSQRLSQPPWGAWGQAMAQLTRSGLISWQAGAADFTMTDVEAAHFLRGGWLEEYAWHVAHDEGLFDARMGVNGYWQKSQKTRNEFDVLATHGNQLLYIECKTLRFQEGNDNELAYKLDSLGRDVRGLFGDTWLLTARPATEQLQARARQARVRIVGPDELPMLRDHIRAWKAGKP
jgi:hypothetical protein